MNFEAVKKIVAYADEQGAKHGKNFRYTITTNGILLDDEKMDYINQHMSNVVLSIDGRKEVNDENRKSPNGKGCYDVIVPQISKDCPAAGTGQLLRPRYLYCRKPGLCRGRASFGGSGI